MQYDILEIILEGKRSEFLQTDVVSSQKQRLRNLISLYLYNIKSVGFLASSYIISTKPGSRNYIFICVPY